MIFTQIWGVTIGSAVLQNELSKTLPPSFIQSIPQGTGTAVPTLYAFIPDFSTLPPHIRSEVQDAFTNSLVVLWQVLTAVYAVGGVASSFMRGFVLSHSFDEAWAMRERERNRELEATC